MVVTDQVIQHNHRAKLQDTTLSQSQNPGYNSHRAILQDTTVTEPNPGYNSHRAKTQDTIVTEPNSRIQQSQSQTPQYNTVTEPNSRIQQSTQSQSQNPGGMTITINCTGYPAKIADCIWYIIMHVTWPCNNFIIHKQSLLACKPCTPLSTFYGLIRHSSSCPATPSLCMQTAMET